MRTDRFGQDFCFFLSRIRLSLVHLMCGPFESFIFHFHMVSQHHERNMEYNFYDRFFRAYSFQNVCTTVYDVHASIDGENTKNKKKNTK